MELIDYLHTHFLTRAQLLAACATDGARLDAFTAAGTMPAPSYRLRVRIDCTSFFGDHAEDHAVDWHARGNVAWMRMLLDGAGMVPAAVKASSRVSSVAHAASSCARVRKCVCR